SVQAAFEQVEQYGCDLLLRFFQAEGLLRAAGERYTEDELFRRIQLAPRYRRLGSALIEILVREGLLQSEGQGFRSTDETCVPERRQRLAGLAETRDRLEREHPWTGPFLGVLSLSLDRYGEVLRGKVAATEVLFAGPALPLVERLYRDNPIADAYNRMV